MTGEGGSLKLGYLFYRFLVSKSVFTVSWTLFEIFFLWSIIEQYHSVFLTALIPTISMAVQLLATIPVGHVIDQLNKTVLNFLASVIFLGGITLLFLGQMSFIIYIIVAISSFANTLKGDTFFSLIKERVRNEGINKANSFNQMSVSLSSLIGIGFAGISLILLSHYIVLFLLILSAVSIFTSIPVKSKIQAFKTHERGRYRDIWAIFNQIKGFVAFGLVVNGMFVAITVYAAGLLKLYVHSGPLEYTLFEFSFPLGMLFGSLLSLSIIKNIDSYLVVGGLVFFYAPLILVLGLNRIAWIDILTAFLIGLLNPLINIPLMSRFTKVVPLNIFGRVSAFLRIFLSSSTPVMAALLAFISLYYEVNVILTVIGLFMIPFSLLGLKVVRNFYKLESSESSISSDQI
ncbi:MAG: hypothetical protein M1344_00135 [Candidatus Thermoplasmatota archaeon]|nr:hypothetical protein [Candidatus Thermoplasmatota archaeon]